MNVTHEPSTANAHTHIHVENEIVECSSNMILHFITVTFNDFTTQDIVRYKIGNKHTSHHRRPPASVCLLQSVSQLVRTLCHRHTSNPTSHSGKSIKLLCVRDENNIGATSILRQYRVLTLRCCVALCKCDSLNGQSYLPNFHI